MITSIKLRPNVHGSKILIIKIGKHVVAIQTNQNLPDTHRNGIHEGTINEAIQHINTYGTAYEKQVILQISNSYKK